MDANIALDAAIANSSNSLTQASAVDSVRTAEVVENLLTVLQPPVENIHTSQIAVEVASSAAYKIVTAICDLAASNLLMNRGPNTPARSNRYGAATPSKSRKSRAMAIALDNAHENPEAVVASFALKRLMDARRQSNGSMATTTTTATTTMIADGAIPLQKLKEMCRAFVEENGYTPDLAISVVYLLDTHKLIRIDRSTKQHLVYSTI
ncbi:hypothetical protein GQ42DRAFT_156988 [Ramicandelaber brevisporus]|nr:hypothetical protein GQ42DRAFT_156988 [Ramicandelaber brevisporus]